MMRQHEREGAAGPIRAQAGQVFTPMRRGPADPPPLGARVEYRAEAQHRWWAIAADGRVLLMTDSEAMAQARLSVTGGVTRKAGTDG
jgi:hypothetical protein